MAGSFDSRAGNPNGRDTAAASGQPRLRLQQISKGFPGILANDRIDLQVMPGEIHALLGENGAGKSTLVKCIYGIQQPDSGTIDWEGQQVVVRTPAQARRLGIGMVFQHFSLFDTLTIAENIALGLDNAPSPKVLSKRIMEVSELYGLPLDPRQVVLNLSVGERQRVEIVRCLLQNPHLLIMDEPTSVLTPRESNKLFNTLRQIREEGISILYISHKLAEIQALCEAATVLRQGQVSAHCDPREHTPQSLAEMMIGESLPQTKRKATTRSSKPILALCGLDWHTREPFGTQLRNLTLAVHGGEIVGVAGVSGSGQAELMRLLSGEQLADKADQVIFDGTPVGRLMPALRRNLGLAFVPEERLDRASVPTMNLVENTLLTHYHRGLIRHGLIRASASYKQAQAIRERFDVRCAGITVRAGSLSGGNLQKFIVGREIMQDPKLLVAGQPTWGVDVGAANAIRQSLMDIRQQGCAILVFSEDLDELFEISDRLTVIYNGVLSSPVEVENTSREEIGRWMGGLFPRAEALRQTAAQGN